jgi:hypothetical protein
MPLRGLEARFQCKKPRSKETAAIRALSEPAYDDIVLLVSQYVMRMELAFVKNKKKGLHFCKPFSDLAPRTG